MKKIQVILTVGLLLSLSFAAASVFADTQPTTAELVKPTKVANTPGAKATDKANERATQGAGNGNAPENTPGAMATERATERATEKPEKLEGKRSTFKGTVTAAGSGSLTLALANGDSITFVVTDTTKIKVPTLGPDATLADVRTGAQAMVQALQTEDGSWTALHIHIVPGKPVGVVTEYVAGASITIQAKDGNTYTFAITPDTKITPRHRANQLGVGARVTITLSRDMTGPEWTARGIVIHSNPSPMATNTTVPPTATNTPVPPGVTNTPLPATATHTPLPPTATKTLLPPTATDTSLPPTATKTSLPPTATNTSLPPTATKTSLPPTATNTSLPPTATPITWNGYVGPLLATKCTGCHGTVLKLGGVSVATYQDALAVVVPGNPAGSKLVKKLQTNTPPHQLPMDELANVIAWIQAGAPEK